MKKIYLTLLTLTVACGSLFAQSRSYSERPTTMLKSDVAPRVESEQTPTDFNRASSDAIWSDDFSDPSTWVAEFDATASTLEWEIGMNLGSGGPIPIDTINSTTAFNGYAMIDSDEYGGSAGGSEVEDSWFTTANSIDLSGNDNVVLRFETQYRKWTSEECYVVISTNNTDWPELTPTTDISTMPNVFYVWPDMATQANVDNPTLKRINISEAAGGEATVWIRFHWTGTWGYSWFVDDVDIVPQPANDLEMLNAYVSHNGTGEEYGRIPYNQTGQGMTIGSQVLNFGMNQQDNIDLTVEFTGPVAFSAAAAQSQLATEATATLEDLSVSTTLTEGVYTGTYTVVSDNDSVGGVTFGNNSLSRKFEVTDSIYSTDGVGIYDNPEFGALGTTITDNEDGLMVFSYYDVTEPIMVKGLQVILANGTVPGGYIFASIHDTSNIFAGDVINTLDQSGVYDVTAADSAAGSLSIYFDSAYELENNAYFVSCELFSNEGDNTVRILDDETVPQPSYLTMIYTPSDQTVYTNGTAAGIRLILEPLTSGVTENVALDGITIYPNPTEGMIRIEMEDQDMYRVEVMNVLGGLIYSSTATSNTSIDLNRFGSGLYVVRVSTDAASHTEKVVVK